jgi:hypothetical protein
MHGKSRIPYPDRVTRLERVGRTQPDAVHECTVCTVQVHEYPGISSLLYLRVPARQQVVVDQ